MCASAGADTQKVALESRIIVADVAVQRSGERIQLVHNAIAITGVVGADHGLRFFDQLSVPANVMLVSGKVMELHQPLLSNRVGLGALQDQSEQTSTRRGIKLIDQRFLCGGDEAILRVVLVDQEPDAGGDVVCTSSSHGRSILFRSTPPPILRRLRTMPLPRMGKQAPSLAVGISQTEGDDR
jgi:hypothetical protein